MSLPRPETTLAALSELTNALNSRIQWFEQALVRRREIGRFEIRGRGYRFPPFGQPDGRDIRQTWKCRGGLPAGRSSRQDWLPVRGALIDACDRRSERPTDDSGGN